MSEKKRKKDIDLTILLPVIFLVLIGIMMIFSSSSVQSLAVFGDEMAFLKKQAMFSLLGFAVLIVASHIDSRVYYRLAVPIMVLNWALLLLTKFSPLSVTSHDVTRWIDIGFRFQTSEFTKFANIVGLAYIISRNRERMRRLDVLLFALFICGTSVFLVLIQPSFSAALSIAVVGVSMLFMGGISIFHTIGLFALGVAGSLILVIIRPYRLKRLASFLDPFHDPSGASWQISNSIFAIASGGLNGVGYGKSIQKYFYISEPQNDFIFAAIAEELGFFKSTAILMIYIYLIYRIFVLFEETKSLFSQMLVCGIGTQIGLQTFMNVAVTTSMVPTTGIGLPFISYGGTSILMFLFMIGVLLSISRDRAKAPVRKRAVR